MPTVKELKEQIRKHNKRQCIRLSQRKAALQAALASVSHSGPAPAPAPAPPQHPSKAHGHKKKKKKKRIAPMLISTSVGGGSSMGGGGGGTKKRLPSVGQKNFNKKLKKQKKAYKKLGGMDANPELAF